MHQFDFFKSLGVSTLTTLLSVGLTGCIGEGPLPFLQDRSSNKASVSLIDETTVSGAFRPGKAAQFDVNETGIKGTRVNLSANSLNLPTDIFIEESSISGASLAKELALEAAIEDASKTVSVQPEESQKVNLQSPMTLSLPLLASSGFRLQTKTKISVVYHGFVFDDSGKKVYRMGVIPQSELRVQSEKEVEFETQIWGSFKVVRTEVELPRQEKETAVANHTVREEKVMDITLGPFELQLASSAVDPVSRKLIVQGLQIEGQEEVKQCLVSYPDTLNRFVQPPGVLTGEQITAARQGGLAFDLTIEQSRERQFYARIECQTVSGRRAAVQGQQLLLLPALPLPAPHNLKFGDIDPAPGMVGGRLDFEHPADKHLVSHYVLYFGDAASQKIGGPIAEVPVEQNFFDIALGTPLPPINTTEFKWLVFARNAEVEAEIPAVTSLVDFGDSSITLPDTPGLENQISTASRSGQAFFDGAYHWSVYLAGVGLRIAHSTDGSQWQDASIASYSFEGEIDAFYREKDAANKYLYVVGVVGIDLKVVRFTLGEGTVISHVEYLLGGASGGEKILKPQLAMDQNNYLHIAWIHRRPDLMHEIRHRYFATAFNLVSLSTQYYVSGDIFHVGKIALLPKMFDSEMSLVLQSGSALKTYSFSSLSWFPDSVGMGDRGWHSPMSSVSGPVYALAQHGDAVYVGGSFHGIGNNPHANGIAKWNGTSFEALGRGIPAGGAVDSIFVDAEGDVYVGGYFSGLDINLDSSQFAHHIARWDGVRWHALPGLNGRVVSIHQYNGMIVAGGFFSDANVQRLARWNGSGWEKVGGMDFSAPVITIEVVNHELYVGGDFSSPFPYAAKFDGSSWTDLGGLGQSVRVLKFHEGHLYAGGMFSGLKKWNGTWVDVGGISGSVFALDFMGPKILIGGNFTGQGGGTNNHVVEFDTMGSSFTAPLLGLNGPARAVMYQQDKIWAGGNFRIADFHKPVLHLFSDSPSDPGPRVYNHSTNGAIQAVAELGSKTYFGGSVSGLNPGEPNSIYQYDGQTVLPMAAVSGGSIYSMVPYGSGMFIGGSFTHINATAGWSKLVYWDGASFYPISVVGNAVYDLKIDGTDLYVGGDFTEVQSVGSKNIIKCNITSPTAPTCSSLATAADGVVKNMEIVGTDLYVSGLFFNIHGTTAAKIAKWDGAAWYSLGTGVSGTGDINALATDETDLFVGGTFRGLDGDSALEYLAKWNGIAFSAIGPSFAVGTDIRALNYDGSELHIGGRLEYPGKSSNLIHFDLVESTWKASQYPFWGDIVASLFSITDKLLVGANLIGGMSSYFMEYSPAPMVNTWDVEIDNSDHLHVAFEYGNKIYLQEKSASSWMTKEMRIVDPTGRPQIFLADSMSKDLFYLSSSGYSQRIMLAQYSGSSWQTSVQKGGEVPRIKQYECSTYCVLSDMFGSYFIP